jgi:hypothetical protein
MPSLRLDRRAVARGLVGVGVVFLLAGAGSGWFRWFDTALAGYFFGVVFAVFATLYRYSVWLQRPPTAKLRRRGWEALRRRDLRSQNLRSLPALLGANLLAQTFIGGRSRARWLGHQLVFWGCIIAVAVTFPLTFGWIHFRSVGQQAANWELLVADLGIMTVDARGPVMWVFFHALDLSAVLVLAGVFIFLIRRLREPGSLVTERAGDHLALAGLFAVSVTGLMLTVSHQWMEGRFYSFLNVLHALTVVLGLMYIPFGKLFHIFQRPGNLGVAFYQRAAEEGPPACCVECDEPYASALQVGDLEEVLPALGFRYEAAGIGNYQRLCPACRRRSVARSQSARVSGLAAATLPGGPAAPPGSWPVIAGEEDT